MADPEHPIPLATVIWFGSLKFMSLGYGYVWSSSRPGTRSMRITSSPSLGEHSVGTVALDRREPPDDDEPGATAVFTSRRVVGFPDPVPLS
jgi:hypothetical protein